MTAHRPPDHSPLFCPDDGNPETRTLVRKFPPVAELRRDLAEIPTTDPNVAAPDHKRLAGQNLAILNRLRQGPATNRELAGLALKYTSRLSDIRAAGFAITCRDDGGGLSTYRLTT